MSDLSAQQLQRVYTSLYEITKIALDLDLSITDFRRYYGHVRFHGEDCDRCDNCIINSCNRGCIEQDEAFNDFILEVVKKVSLLEDVLWLRVIAQDLNTIDTQESTAP